VVLLPGFREMLKRGADAASAMSPAGGTANTDSWSGPAVDEARRPATMKRQPERKPGNLMAGLERRVPVNPRRALSGQLAEIPAGARFPQGRALLFLFGFTVAAQIARAVMFEARIAVAIAAIDADFHDGFLLKQHSGAALSQNGGLAQIA
jgi:hypothetical protein